MQHGLVGYEPRSASRSRRRDGTLQSIADRDLWHGGGEDKTGLSKREACMNLLWVYVGFAVVALLLVLLLARAVGNSQRRRIRKQLGLPLDSRLSRRTHWPFVRSRTPTSS